MFNLVTMYASQPVDNSIGFQITWWLQLKNNPFSDTFVAILICSVTHSPTPNIPMYFYGPVNKMRC